MAERQAAMLPQPAPISVEAFLPGVDYVDGVKVEGIIWRHGYSHVKVSIANPSGESYLELNVVIRPELPIIEGNVHSEFASCKFGPANVPLSPLILSPSGSNGQLIGASEHVEGHDINIVSTYRLVCDRLPAKAQITIDLMTVQPINDVMSSEMWMPERKDPTFIDVFSSYSAFGERKEDNSRLTFQQHA